MAVQRGAALLQTLLVLPSARCLMPCLELRPIVFVFSGVSRFPFPIAPAYGEYSIKHDITDIALDDHPTLRVSLAGRGNVTPILFSIVFPHHLSSLQSPAQYVQGGKPVPLRLSSKRLGPKSWSNAIVSSEGALLKHGYSKVEICKVGDASRCLGC